MLDPKLLRESPDTVRAAIAKKHLQVEATGRKSPTARRFLPVDTSTLCIGIMG
jgi:hypothetical protein